MIEHTQLVKMCRAFIEPTSVISSERLLNGFSNDNFLIRTKQQGYLLKCYKSHWPAIGLEAQRFLSDFNICPAPIWLDKENGRAVFNYIEGKRAQSDITLSFINKLAQMHKYNVFTTPMDIAKELYFYQNTDVYTQYKSQIEHALKAVAAMPFNEGFCHNDLVKDNIIVNASGMYLIDFEYAQTNDVYFDLAALAVSFDLNEQSKKELLNNYRNSVDKKSSFSPSMAKLNCYKLLFLVLCIGWYEERSITNESAMLRAQLTKLVNNTFYRC
ncbi:MAG TPA: choline kinase [Pseudoalteromonas sp.]|uniref:Aminoglycoside phosphotransferase domain-containing protein n=1 Tax=marine sediment metagenome TaxID=412755 RepID=A0A0F9MQP3_9ZZZZ|nr:phosphotransferase [Pseudoalteromonas sp.]HDY92935.1 choline kinase [Pseudoalteromonas sp.]HDZ33546.1 choline kinase [Pseudoalteromonas sp.]